MTPELSRTGRQFKDHVNEKILKVDGINLRYDQMSVGRSDVISPRKQNKVGNEDVTEEEEADDLTDTVDNEGNCISV